MTRLRHRASLNERRDRYFRYVGGATGYTDYPTLDAQPSSESSDSIVALDGDRVA
ncbi:NADH:flavin oxidoreductase [Streptomyces azureus]|uniref:NADH:flavin oxidoreductase n=1 Tax=Streptomyces azureus TaxID=146537 RepID=A0A0K8PQQ9_STRAJ|nr:NADH:flavin oxidoreductase [Streptomyces azureus]